MENKYIEKYNELLGEIKTELRRLNGALSAVDSERSDILHFYEFETYDAITMVKLAKKLKLVQQKRREIKHELAAVQATYDRLKKGSAIAIKPIVKNVTYKTDVIKEFLDSDE